jgi:hypothetical protein
MLGDQIGLCGIVGLRRLRRDAWVETPEAAQKLGTASPCRLFREPNTQLDFMQIGTSVLDWHAVEAAPSWLARRPATARLFQTRQHIAPWLKRRPMAPAPTARKKRVANRAKIGQKNLQIW